MRPHITREPIKLDGLLEEETWKQAEVAGDFLERFPIEGKSPSQPTRVRVLLSESFLYIGVECRDSSPDKIIAKEKRRDASLDMVTDLKFNTDFAQTEVDEQRVNLTRFPLFFPEKRDFFLENSGVFEFTTSSARPFFSRRIGLYSGREIPLLGGARLTGKVDRFNFGLLSV